MFLSNAQHASWLKTSWWSASGSATSTSFVCLKEQRELALALDLQLQMRLWKSCAFVCKEVRQDFWSFWMLAVKDGDVGLWHVMANCWIRGIEFPWITRHPVAVITRHQSKQAKRQMNIGEMQILNQTLRTDSLFGLVKSRAGTQQILQSWYVCTLRSTCVHVQLLDAAACRCCMHARIYSVAVITAQGYIMLRSPPH